MHPGLKIVGVYSPRVGFENDLHEIEYINAMLNKLQPNIVFVGLDTPSQEKWIYKYGRTLNVGVLLAVGTAIERVASCTKKAPKLVRKSGFEKSYISYSQTIQSANFSLNKIEFLKFLL